MRAYRTGWTSPRTVSSRCLQAKRPTLLDAIPVALTARITSNGLVNPHTWNLKNSADLSDSSFTLFSAAAYAGSGDLYFGIQAAQGQPPGVLTASFTQNPLSIKLKKAVAVDPEKLEGNIAVTGNLMVIAQYPSQISVFRIQKNGSLKLLSTTTIDEQGEGLFSLSIFYKYAVGTRPNP